MSEDADGGGRTGGARRAGLRRAPAWLALAALVALTPWILWPRWPTREPMTDLKWPFVAWGALAVVALAFFHRRAPSDPADPRAGARRLLFASAAAIVVGLFASSAFSPAPGLGFRVALRETMFLALACRLATLPIGAHAVRLVFAAFIASASLQAALTIGQHLNVEPGGRLTGRAAMIGAMGNPEWVAGFLAPALAASIAALLAGAGRRATRWLLAGAIAILGGSIVLSGGRGAALSVVGAAFLAWFALRRRRRESPRARAPLWFALGLVALLLVASAAMMGGEVRRQALVGRIADAFNPYSASIRHRVGLVVVTSRMIWDRPLLGAGPGRFGAAFDRARGRLARESESLGPWVFNDVLSDRAAAEAHCDPLQWWAEYGLAPFLGLMVILSSLLTSLWRESAREGGAAEAPMLLAALAALAIGMIFSFPLHRPARALLFWSLAGAAAAPRDRASGSGDDK